VILYKPISLNKVCSIYLIIKY